MDRIGYSSYRDARLQPPDGDDRWEAIAERLEGECATGAKLRELAADEVEGFDLAGELAAIHEGHADDIAAASERLIRRLLSHLNDRIERTAKEDAIAEVERADDEAEQARGEAMFEARRAA